MAKKTSAHGGARKGAGRKPALTIPETWEASRLCDLLEQRQIEAWALRATYGKNIAKIAAAQQAIREHPIQFRSWGDGLEQLQDNVEAAFHVAGPVSDDLQTAAEYKPKKIYLQTVEFKRVGRRPNGIAARERVIAIVARYLRRKWQHDVSASSVRKAWKASRRLWRETSAEDDPKRED